MVPPKLTRVFLMEAADTSTPEFKAWFRNSKVVDFDNKPMVMYHGTTAPGNFEVFRQAQDIGHHFGTRRAANARLHKDDVPIAGFNNEPPTSSRIYPVYLSIQKPLRLEDLGTWEPTAIAWSLNGEGIISKEEREQIQMMSSKERQMPKLIQALKSKGYDGIIYQNMIEDKGSFSWIAFDPGQIKSVFNRGTWDKRRGSIME